LGSDEHPQAGRLPGRETSPALRPEARQAARRRRHSASTPPIMRAATSRIGRSTPSPPELEEPVIARSTELTGLGAATRGPDPGESPVVERDPVGPRAPLGAVASATAASAEPSGPWETKARRVEAGTRPEVAPLPDPAERVTTERWMLLVGFAPVALGMTSRYWPTAELPGGATVPPWWTRATAGPAKRASPATVAAIRRNALPVISPISRPIRRNLSDADTLGDARDRTACASTALAAWIGLHIFTRLWYTSVGVRLLANTLLWA
jgi:hypothetical protein